METREFWGFGELKVTAKTLAVQIDNDVLEGKLANGEWESVLAEELTDLAESHKESELVCRTNCGASVDFGHHGFSVWVVFSGSPPLVRASLKVLRELIPQRNRREEMATTRSTWIPRIRIADGKVWIPYDGGTWSQVVRTKSDLLPDDSAIPYESSNGLETLADETLDVDLSHVDLSHVDLLDVDDGMLALMTEDEIEFVEALRAKTLASKEQLKKKTKRAANRTTNTKAKNATKASEDFEDLFEELLSEGDDASDDSASIAPAANASAAKAASTKPSPKKSGQNAAQPSVRIGYYMSKIERVFKLPAGSVKFHHPEGSIASPNLLVANLRKRWGEK